jgi:hypothetical protein
MYRPRMVLLILALGFAGCGESPRVERKPLVESTSQPAPTTTGELPPHGMTPPAMPSVDLNNPEVSLGTARLTAPKSWNRKPPKSGFLLAEFSLPRAEGDPADGRLTVSAAGGSIADNVARWRGQFGSKPEKESQGKLEVAGIPVTLVDFSGTYQNQQGMMGPVVEAPNYRMLGAIFELGGQMYFLKAYGPVKTMSAHAGEFQDFVKSLKKAS